MDEQEVDGNKNISGNEGGDKRQEEKQNPLLIPGAIIVAGVLIAGAVMYSRNANIPLGARQGANVRQTQGENNPQTALGKIEDDDPMMGNPNAPVTIVEFSDFQCPFCGKFFEGTEKQIIEKYIKTGKARFVYRDFPLASLHTMAQKAAEAGECAHEQGKFWEYHDMVFKNQIALSSENLKKWAADLGLKTGQFDSCLDSGKYAQEVQKDLDDGIARGVTGTPTNFINGIPIVGAVPFSQIESLIESALKGE